MATQTDVAKSGSVTEQFGWVPTSANLAVSLARAQAQAGAQSHRFVTLEHLLFALSDDADAVLVLRSCNVDANRLRQDIAAYLGQLDDRVEAGETAPQAAHDDLLKILRTAAEAARQVRRSQIDGAIVLAALVGEGRSPAADFLKSYGLTFEAAIRSLQTRSSEPETQRSEEAELGAGPGSQFSTDADTAKVTEAAAAPRSQTAGETAASPPKATDSSAARAPARQVRQDAKPGTPPSETTPTTKPQPHAQKASSTTPPARSREPGPTSEPAGKGDRRRPTKPPSPAATPAPGGAGSDTDDESRIEAQASSAPKASETKPAPKNSELAALPMSRQRGAPPSPSAQAPAQPPRPTTPPPDRERAGQHHLPPLPLPPPDRPSEPEPLRLPPAAGAPEPIGPVAIPPWPEASQRKQLQPHVPQPDLDLQAAGSIAGPPFPPPDAVISTQPAASDARRSHAPDGAAAVRTGKLIENIPRRMRVQVPCKVEVRVTRDGQTGISEGISGVVHQHELNVTKAMAVRLRAPDGGFHIEPGSPETQWISFSNALTSADFATWHWRVTPQARGRMRLRLVVSSRTIAHDGLTAETVLPDRVVDIRVRTNYRLLARRWSIWLFIAIFGGVLGRFGESAFDAAAQVAHRILNSL